MHFSSPTGLIAAALTPMTPDGELALDVIPPLVEYLIDTGVQGLYVCGSTGEGMSLTSAERQEVAAAFVAAAGERIPVLVQVGHNSLREAADLARHAKRVRATGVSATCPNYFKVQTIEGLVRSMGEIAAAADGLPFYYYHIPMLTGVRLSMPEFLNQAAARIKNLAGLKFTAPELDEFDRCRRAGGGRWQIYWGCDEMLLPALCMGANAAIGSTYNFAAPLYRRMMEAVDEGQLDEARRLQSQAIDMITILLDYPFLAAAKAVMGMLGFELGTVRPPLDPISRDQQQELRGRLEAIGFFDWATIG